MKSSRETELFSQETKSKSHKDDLFSRMIKIISGEKFNYFSEIILFSREIFFFSRVINLDYRKITLKNHEKSFARFD
jgi:hypothetical protein